MTTQVSEPASRSRLSQLSGSRTYAPVIQHGRTGRGSPSTAHRMAEISDPRTTSSTAMAQATRNRHRRTCIGQVAKRIPTADPGRAWYLVQSKQRQSVRSTRTFFDEGPKVIHTLHGNGLGCCCSQKLPSSGSSFCC